jgi:tRNA A-37 threonylcarbamoyl transferase component Bud32
MIGRIVGNCKLLEKLGEGGMGAVFKGVDLMLEREVAVKMLRPELARQPELVERFRSEAVTLAKLLHPNIATLYSFLRQGDDFFMIMEYVAGRTLDEAIRSGGAMTPATAVPLFCQALDGVEYAHRQRILHRDLKPANLMLTADGSIKVMDFGIARVLGAARVTRAGNLVGTIEYMSPERIHGEETDIRSDLYSLGIVLYEMLTGRVPFSSPSEYELLKMQVEVPVPPPRSLVPAIPEGIEAALLRSLAKKPGERFATAADFRAALVECSIEVAESAPPAQLKATRMAAAPVEPVAATRIAANAPAPAAAPVPSARPRPARWLLVAAAVALLIVLTAVAGVVYIRRAAQPPAAAGAVQQVTPQPAATAPGPMVIAPSNEPASGASAPGRTLEVAPTAAQALIDGRATVAKSQATSGQEREKRRAAALKALGEASAADEKARRRAQALKALEGK